MRGSFLLFVSIILSYSFPSYANVGWANCLTGDLWVVSDMSGSMKHYETYVVNAMDHIAHGLLQDNVKARMGVITFNFKPTLYLEPTSDLVQIGLAIKEIETIIGEGGTNIGKALQGAYDTQQETPKSPYQYDSDFKKMILLISDGEDNVSDDTLEVAYALKEQGWWIFSIFVHKDNVSDQTHKNSMDFLKEVSGNREMGSHYVDSVLLWDLPQYFREQFNCF